MAKKSRDNKRRSPNRSATRRPRAIRTAPAPSQAAAEPLIAPLREALRDPDPLTFWAASTAIVSLVDDPGDLGDSLPEGVDLLQTFIDVDIAETTALLHMVGALSADELTRARARRAVRTRHQPVPPHVSGLAELTVTEARVFGDHAGDNHLLELALPGEVRVTLVSYVERTPRLYLKDAFFVGERLESVQDRFAQMMVGKGLSAEQQIRDLPPAQSRAALEQALAAAPEKQIEPPEPGDHWPMCRPIVEFVLSRMPEGGDGYDSHGLLIGQDDYVIADPFGDRFADDGEDWLDEESARLADDIAALAEEFLESAHAQRLPRSESTSLLVRSLLMLAEAAESDALHWCSETVRWVLEDALPVSPVISRETVLQSVEVLPALVRWAHEESTTDPATTADLLNEMVPLLERLPSRWQDREMMVARLDGATEVALMRGDLTEFSRALLVQQVGGVEALQELSANPLPVEPLTLGGVAEDLHDKLTDVDAELVAALQEVMVDQLPELDQEMGAEFLTACRRFLVQAATEDPEVLRGRAGARTTAAAAAWIVGRGNHLVGSGAPVRTGRLMQAFDLKSPPSQRAERLQRAARLPDAPIDIALGSPDLLVASARREILTQRDHLDDVQSE